MITIVLVLIGVIAVLMLLIGLLYFSPHHPPGVQPTPYGESQRAQKIKLWLANRRPQPLQVIRCVIGRHNPPANKAFSCMGAVMIGGTCRRGDDETFREICFIGNMWEFPGGSEEEDEEGAVHLKANPLGVFSFLSDQGINYIGDVGF